MWAWPGLFERRSLGEGVQPGQTGMTYSDAVRARAQDPERAGWLRRDAPDVGTGEAGSIDSGAMTRIQVRIAAASRRIEEAVFKVVGDDAAIASASLVTEWLEGAPVDAARDMEGFAIVAELQLPMERAGLAALAVDAARRAIEDWERKASAEGPSFRCGH
jgi:nitrogen fixation NifU-like protein